MARDHMSDGNGRWGFVPETCKINSRVDKVSDVPRPPADPNRPATPDRLLDAAEGVFAASGYAAARLEDIAGGAGVQRASLLHHFGSKEALYAEVVRRSFDALGTALAAATARPGSFEPRLKAVVETFARFVDARPSLARIILREMVATEGPGRAILLDQVVPLLSRVEAFVRRDGRGLIPRGLPVRAAVLDTATSLLVRAASGDLRGPLWGGRTSSWAVARHLFTA